MSRLIFLSVGVLAVSCCCHKDMATVSQAPPPTRDSAVAITGPPTIVYRTRMDVGDAVPMTLSGDGSEVLSYPHPRDLLKGDGYATPTQLEQGYLLDNRGIGPNTVFLRWSYAEYAAMDKAPSLEELLAGVEFRDPFEEMYDCGVRSKYVDPVKEMNDLVRSGGLASRCKKLK